MTLARMVVLLAAVGLLAQPALAQDHASGGDQLTQEDREFAMEAAQGGLKEVQLGELAQQQAGSPDVSDFGQLMVEDHSEANAKLKQIAEQKGLELPQELSENARQQYEELEQLSHEPFDQAYMELMVKDHQEDVEAFEQQAQAGQDSDLKGFADETLPTLREHPELAQQLQSSVGRGGG